MRHRLLGLLALMILGCGGGGDAGPGGDDIAPPVEVIAADTVAPETGAGDTPRDLPPPDYSPVVFTVVSDIHIEGGIDNSISKKVAGLLAAAGNRDPAPEFIAVTGDLVDVLAEPVDTGPGSKIDALRQLFDGAPVPVEVALGNHDYYTTGDAIFSITPDPEARSQLFEDELGIETWHVTEHGGMRFVYLNSMADPYAAESLGLNGSMGAAQLQWLDGLLSDGVAAILFMHHPPGIVQEDGEASLGAVIQAHADSVLAIFVGHIHVWGQDAFEGVPVYLTEAGYDGDGMHHVRVDPAAGTVEILNADETDYGETEVVPCDPARDPVLTDPAGLEGLPLALRVPDAHIQPMGLGTYLRELIGEVPLVVRLGTLDGSQAEIAALFTVGVSVGDGADGAPPYIKPITDGPCVASLLALDGPCFTSSPVTLEIDLGRILGFPLPPGWRIRAELRDLVLSGVLTDSGLVEQGVLEATLDFTLGARDLEAIITQEYCKGTEAGCVPGAAGMPACPEEPGPEFFAQIPVACDVSVLGIGLRLVFRIFESVPDLAVALDANFQVWPASVLEEPAPGGIAPALFAPIPEGTCPGL